MSEEAQKRIDLRFDAWCGGWYQHKRAEFLSKVVMVCQVLGALGTIAGILTFGRAPSWLPYVLLSVGVASLILVQVRRIDIRAQKHRDVSARYYAIASKIEHNDKVSTARLAKELEAVHAEASALTRDALQTLHILGCNAWQDYSGEPGGRYRVTWLERWTANVWNREPAGGWGSRLVDGS